MVVKRVQKIKVKSNVEYFDYLKYLTKVSKNLYNCALFLQRQAYFHGQYISYNELDNLCKIETTGITKHYKKLPAQVAQQTLRKLDKNWKSYFESKKEYVKNPNKFKGFPKPPKYLDKDGSYELNFTEQYLRWDENSKEIVLKHLGFFSEIRIKPKFEKMQGLQKIDQLKIQNKGNYILISIIYDRFVEDTKLNGTRSIGIDIGIDNLLTISGDIDTPIIVNGKGLKSINQFYNKTSSQLKSELQTKNKKYWSKRLQNLTDKRNFKIENSLHKTSKWLVNFCLENAISNIVIGKTNGWKDKSKLSKQVNQNFIQIPFARLIQMIQYKAEEKGLNVFLQEESYTSKSSFLDNDKIPTYKKLKKQKDGTYKEVEEPKYKFSGKRIKRGLYKRNCNQVINADVNGSLNILRKSKVSDESCEKIISRGFVSNPVKINIF